MKELELQQLLIELTNLPNETEWVEFKVNNDKPQEIGEYISAISNSACILNKDFGYVVWGINDKTHEIIGTKFSPKKMKVRNEELENWLSHLLNPRINFFIYEFYQSNNKIVIFKIQSALNIPVEFSGQAFIRVGSYKKKLKDYPEKQRLIWNKLITDDWSSQIISDASINSLDASAIEKAKANFIKKNPKFFNDINNWGDVNFLNKAKLTIDGQITNTAIILLGKSESEHYLKPSIAKISWILRNVEGNDKDYEHFSPPFLLAVDRVFSKIRNLKYRFLQKDSLIADEINMYDDWIIREALHNCIAHQDYRLTGRITIIEKPNELIFTNLGSFLPGDLEEYIQRDIPPSIYRNRFLTDAMVNLNMIDTIGSGIRKMYLRQRERFFPMPDYDLSKPNEVTVKIYGETIDENYTSLLMGKTDLDLRTIIILDKVQKKQKINKEVFNELKRKKLVEGRFPNIFIASQIASITGDKSSYIKNKGFSNKYYQDLIIEFLKKHKHALRKDINDLLFEKLPDILNDGQKERKINNLLFSLSKKNKIENKGSRKAPKWVLNVDEN